MFLLKYAKVFPKYSNENGVELEEWDWDGGDFVCRVVPVGWEQLQEKGRVSGGMVVG